MNAVKIPRYAKGKRPDFFPEEPGAQRMLSMLMALVTEVAVLRERLDTVEHIAGEKGLIVEDEIEQFEPSLQLREQREAWRQAYLDRILQVLSDEVKREGKAPSWGA